MDNRILIVDDEKSIRFGITHYFEQEGYRVDSAADGLEARALIAANDYHLAIVDIHLGGRNEANDGLDLAAFIRQYAPETAVIVLTGLETPEALRRAAEAGVQAFLRKPTPLASVAEIVAGIIRRRAAAAAALVALR